MTTTELIEILKQYPENTVVTINGEELNSKLNTFEQVFEDEGYWMYVLENEYIRNKTVYTKESLREDALTCAKNGQWVFETPFKKEDVYTQKRIVVSLSVKNKNY